MPTACVTLLTAQAFILACANRPVSLTQGRWLPAELTETQAQGPLPCYTQAQMTL